MSDELTSAEKRQAIREHKKTHTYQNSPNKVIYVNFKQNQEQRNAWANFFGPKAAVAEILEDLDKRKS